MSLITLTSSGRIFQDEFDSASLNPAWEVSPTDPSRYSLNQDRPGYLRLKHGDKPFYLLMNIPNRDFIFEIKNDYAPSSVRDSGGIIVYRDNSTHLDLLEYFDEIEGVVNYTHMRVSKQGSMYTGYGSKDDGRTWEIIGSGMIEDMTKIGLVLYYPYDVNVVDFDVDYVKIFVDNKFIVNNLKPGMKVRLLDNTGIVKRESYAQGSDTFAYIDVSSLPAPYLGQVQVLDETGAILDTSPMMNIWGGDVYWYGLVFEIYKDGYQLESDESTKLGLLTNGLIEQALILKNPSSSPVPDVTVSISPYFSYEGSDWAYISEDNGLGGPVLYDKSIYLGTLNPGEERKLWLKVQKSAIGYVPSLGERQFLLEVSN